MSMPGMMLVALGQAMSMVQGVRQSGWVTNWPLRAWSYLEEEA